MTAKERLVAAVADLSEVEAERVLELLGLEPPGGWPDFPPAPPEVMEKFRRAQAESKLGHRKTTEEIRKQFGLD